MATGVVCDSLGDGKHITDVYSVVVVWYIVGLAIEMSQVRSGQVVHRHVCLCYQAVLLLVFVRGQRTLVLCGWKGNEGLHRGRGSDGG